jgi:hypothetical protein
VSIPSKKRRKKTALFLAKQTVQLPREVLKFSNGKRFTCHPNNINDLSGAGRTEAG